MKLIVLTMLLMTELNYGQLGTSNTAIPSGQAQVPKLLRIPRSSGFWPYSGVYRSPAMRAPTTRGIGGGRGNMGFRAPQGRHQGFGFSLARTPGRSQMYGHHPVGLSQGHRGVGGSSGSSYMSSMGSYGGSSYGGGGKGSYGGSGKGSYGHKRKGSYGRMRTGPHGGKKKGPYGHMSTGRKQKDSHGHKRKGSYGGYRRGSYGKYSGYGHGNYGGGRSMSSGYWSSGSWS